MHKNIEIKELQSEQAPSLSALILNAPGNHTKYFTPFSFKEDAIKKIINVQDWDYQNLLCSMLLLIAKLITLKKLCLKFIRKI